MARTFVAASSQYVSATSVPVSAAPLTLACWAKPASTQSFPTLFALGSSGGTNYYMLGAGNSDSKVNAWQSGVTTSDVAASTTTWTNGVWAHACAVFATDSDRRAYLNGGGKGTNATACGAPSPDRTAIGAMLRASASGFFDGVVAEAAAWTVALSDADVAVLALGVSPLLVRPDALVFYAPLLAGASPEIELIGRRNLTLTGTPAVSAHTRMFTPGLAVQARPAATSGLLGFL